MGGMAAAIRAPLAGILVALSLGAPAPPAHAADPATPDPAPPPRAPLETVNGTIRSVDLAEHVLRVQGDAGAFAVTLDRNTLVYLPTGLASVAELRPGARVRLARDGARACWVEVREQAGSP